VGESTEGTPFIDSGSAGKKCHKPPIRASTIPTEKELIRMELENVKIVLHDGTTLDATIETHKLAPPVTADAKPAPTLERVNLWTVVQASLYDSQKEYAVQCADRVVGALERDKPTVLCVGNVLYFRQDKAIQDAKELRERAATLISSLRSVVDECMERIHRPKVRRATVSGLVKPKRKPTKKTAKKGGKRR